MERIIANKQLSSQGFYTLSKPIERFKKLILGILICIFAYSLAYAVTSEEYLGTQLPTPDTEAAEDSKVILEIRDPRIDNLTRFENIDEEFAKGLIELCETKTQDSNLCLKHIIGVTSSESSVFKRCAHNNCYGLMRCGKNGCSLRRYESKLEATNDWLDIYVDKGWDKRMTGQHWLNGKYCASACTYWISNYNSAINKLGI